MFVTIYAMIKLVIFLEFDHSCVVKQSKLMLYMNNDIYDFE